MGVAYLSVSSLETVRLAEAFKHPPKISYPPPAINISNTLPLFELISGVTTFASEEVGR